MRPIEYDGLHGLLSHTCVRCLGQTTCKRIRTCQIGRQTKPPAFGNLVDFQPLLGLRLGYSCWKPARTGTSQDWFFLRGSYSTCYLVALECTIHNIEHDIGQIFSVGGIPEGPVPSTWTYSVLAGGYTVVWYHGGKQVFLQRASCVVDEVLDSVSHITSLARR